MDRTSEPVSQPQLNVVLKRLALVMVSVHNSKTLTKTEVESIIIKVGAWQYPGRHGEGGAQSSMSSSKGC